MVQSPGMTMSPMSTVATNATDASPTSTTRRSRGQGRGGSRIGSRFRGVTHHSRTARYEAHLWDNGKQVYLGGFTNEAPAALAYDIAGVSYRGPEALLNGSWSIVEQELASRHTISKEEVIQKLRAQSKHMNKVNSNFPVMDKGDLLVSQAMNPHIEHIGVFRSAEDAARAYDRALIEKLGGVLASSFLNFPLYEYLSMLSEDEKAVAISMGIIPETEQSEAELAPPTPLFNLGQAGENEEIPFDVEDDRRSGESPSEFTRRKHTAKSVLDVLCDAVEQGCDDEVGVKRETGGAQSLGERHVRRSKRPRRNVSLYEDTELAVDDE
jgi:hypothetical protein